jgi:uncharacterized protein
MAHKRDFLMGVRLAGRIMTPADAQMILTHPETVPIIGAAMTVRRIGSVEIEDLVARQAQLDFCFPVASLSRLASLAAAVDEPAAVPLTELHASLAFQPGAEGYPQLHLIVGGSVVVTCQRCLQALVWPVDIDLHLTMIRTDSEAEVLAEPFDTLLVSDGLRPDEVVEDEVLAVLPLAPRHAEGQDCEAPAGWDAKGLSVSGEATAKEPTRRPLAGLAALLGRNDQQGND